MNFQLKETVPGVMDVDHDGIWTLPISGQFKLRSCVSNILRRVGDPSTGEIKVQIEDGDRVFEVRIFGKKNMVHVNYSLFGITMAEIEFDYDFSNPSLIEVTKFRQCVRDSDSSSKLITAILSLLESAIHNQKENIYV
jgi:hypothetical protein